MFFQTEQEVKNALNAFSSYSLCLVSSDAHHIHTHAQVTRAPRKSNFTSGLNFSRVYYVVGATSKTVARNFLGPQISKQ